MIAPRKQRKVCSVPVSGAAVGVASVPVAQSVLPLSCVPGSGVCPYFPGMLCSPFGITSLRSPRARWGSGRSISPASVLTARSTHGVPGLSCLSRFSGALRAPRAAWECGCELSCEQVLGDLGSEEGPQETLPCHPRSRQTLQHLVSTVSRYLHKFVAHFSLRLYFLGRTVDLL